MSQCNRVWNTLDIRKTNPEAFFYVPTNDSTQSSKQLNLPTARLSAGLRPHAPTYDFQTNLMNSNKNYISIRVFIERLCSIWRILSFNFLFADYLQQQVMLLLYFFPSQHKAGDRLTNTWFYRPFFQLAGLADGLTKVYMETKPLEIANSAFHPHGVDK